MFAFKKAVVVLGALAAFAVPAIASADDRDGRGARRDDHAVVVEHREHRDRDGRDHRRWDRDDRRWERRGHGGC